LARWAKIASFEKKQLPQGVYAYEFRHTTLGGLGRILLKDLEQGAGKQTYVGCEVAGDPDDPMTAKRLAVFDPIARRMTEELEQALGKGKGVPVTPLPSPTSVQRVLKKLMQCEKCGEFVALLIFAEKAHSLGDMEDYARMMYREVTQYNLPTWVIGPQVGTEPYPERPSDILKIWPSREPVRRLRPDEFNAEIGKLQKAHCGGRAKTKLLHRGKKQRQKR
jgi:hypothetical protein